MSAVSQLREMEVGLFSVLQSAADEGGLRGVALTDGDPGTMLKLEHVYIAEAATGDLRWSTTGLGNQTRYEESTFTVHAYAQRGGAASYAQARDRAHELARAVEDALLADLTLAGTAWTSEITGVRRETMEVEGGRAVLMVLSVLARAYPA